MNFGVGVYPVKPAGQGVDEALAYRPSGFSVNTFVGIAAQDRAGPERLLRAQPPSTGEGALGMG